MARIDCISSWSKNASSSTDIQAGTPTLCGWDPVKGAVHYYLRGLPDGVMNCDRLYVMDTESKKLPPGTFLCLFCFLLFLCFQKKKTAIHNFKGSDGQKSAYDFIWRAEPCAHLGFSVLLQDRASGWGVLQFCHEYVTCISLVLVPPNAGAPARSIVRLRLKAGVG